MTAAMATSHARDTVRMAFAIRVLRTRHTVGMVAASTTSPAGNVMRNASTMASTATVPAISMALTLQRIVAVFAGSASVVSASESVNLGRWAQVGLTQAQCRVPSSEPGTSDCMYAVIAAAAECMSAMFAVAAGSAASNRAPASLCTVADEWRSMSPLGVLRK